MSACCSDLVIVPGPQGGAGADGADGTDGINAYMTLTAQFTMPAELASSAAVTSDNSAFSIGQVVFVQFLGYMEITAKATTTSTTLKNLEDTASGVYTSNAAAGTIAPIASVIAPSGIQGPAGVLSGAAGGQLSGTYPNPDLAITTTKGDLIVRNATVNVRQAVGADGTRIKADSAQATGVVWAAVNLAAATEVTGVLPIANGGTAGANAAAARSALGAAASGANSDITSLSALSTPLSVAQGGTGTTAGINIAPVGVIYLRHQEAATVGGGAFTAGGWRTRPITNEIYDTGGDCTFPTGTPNQFELSAGTYRFFIRAPAYQVNSHILKLYNITLGADVAIGSVARSDSLSLSQTDSFVRARVTIAGATTFEVQHYCQTNGVFGTPSTGFGVNEIYLEIYIEKEG